MVNLKRIKERRVAIGETDWSFCGIDPWYENASTLYLGEDQAITLYGDQSEAKAEFISHAPADIDVLIKEVERLRAALRAIIEIVEE